MAILWKNEMVMVSLSNEANVIHVRKGGHFVESRTGDAYPKK
jgi:hypothetical protein